jgi:hypothetical protein
VKQKSSLVLVTLVRTDTSKETSVAVPDAHHFEKPDPYQSEKQDPDPRQSSTMNTLWLPF